MITTRRTAASTALVTVAFTLVAAGACSGDGHGRFCDAAKELQSAGALAANIGVGSDPAQVRQAFGTARDALDRMADNAPDAIQADATQVADGYAQVVAAIDRTGGDVTAASDEVSVVLDDAEFAAARQRLVTFAAEECGI